MSKDINVTDGTVLETLNNKVDLDGGNYPGSGLEEYINTSHRIEDNITKRQITNCILEIPQRIKYTLENGTLTIKAGSVVIVPYGVEDLTADYPKGATFLNDNFKVYDTQFEDGKFFVWAELVNDIIINPSSQASASRPYTLVMEKGLGWIGEKTYSGIATTAETTYSQYYNTKTNYVNSSTSTTTIITSNNTQCFPFMIAQGSTSEGTKCVDQVFNGIGYIGSTIWVDKGVKGLIPNGRNEDGTLNNIEFETEKVLTLNITGTASRYLMLNGSVLTHLNKAGYYLYDEAGNLNKIPATGGIAYYCNIGIYDCNTNAISNLNPKQPVNLATEDMVDGQWVSTYNTLLTGATTIQTYNLDVSGILPNDGYCYEILGSVELQGGSHTAAVDIGSDVLSSYVGVVQSTGSNGYTRGSFLIPVGTGRQVKMNIAGSAPTKCGAKMFAYRRIGTNT